MDNDEIIYPRKDGSKIIVDRELCIGAASCIIMAGRTFELDNEQKAVVIDADADDLPGLIEAAKSCPVDAIKIVDKDGRRHWPK